MKWKSIRQITWKWKWPTDKLVKKAHVRFSLSVSQGSSPYLQPRNLIFLNHVSCSTHCDQADSSMHSKINSYTQNILQRDLSFRPSKNERREHFFSYLTKCSNISTNPTSAKSYHNRNVVFAVSYALPIAP